jgi:hypothetical protein
MDKKFHLDIRKFDLENPGDVMGVVDDVIHYFKAEVDDCKYKLCELEEKLDYLEMFSKEVNEILAGSEGTEEDEEEKEYICLGRGKAINFGRICRNRSMDSQKKDSPD